MPRRSGSGRWKILTLCCEYPPVGGGGATACQGLAEGLVRAGHRVDVVTSGMEGVARFEELNGSGSTACGAFAAISTTAPPPNSSAS